MSSVSFTVRRPTPISNNSSDVDSNSAVKASAIPQRLKDEHAPRTSSPLNPNGKRKFAFDDSDEEEHSVTEELVVGFDALGAQRANGGPVKEEPLVIAALPNKDWRAAARQRKGFIPNEAKGRAEASKSDLETKDIINSGPQQSGLVTFKKRKLDDSKDGEDTKMEPADEPSEDQESAKKETEMETITDEQLAVNALLVAAKQANEGGSMDEMPLTAIPMPESEDWKVAKSEADAYREDVSTRPDSATLDDYKRVPVSQFGTALLMGMGWKPGQGASKSGKGPSEAIIPKARPALLGLGAKPAEADVAAGQSGKGKPSKRYIPVVSKERIRQDASDTDSARRSDSQSGRRGDNEDSRDPDRRRDRSRDREYGSYSRDRGERRERRDSDREDDRRDDHRKRDRDRHEDRRNDDRRDRYKDKDRDSNRDYHRKDKDYDRGERRREEYRRDEKSEDSRRKK